MFYDKSKPNNYDDLKFTAPIGEPVVQIKPPVDNSSNFRLSVRTQDGNPIDIHDDHSFGNVEWWYAARDDAPWTKMGHSAIPGLREGDIIKLPPQTIGRFTMYVVGVCIRADRGTGLLGFDGDEEINDNEGDEEFIYGAEEERDPAYTG